MVGIVIVSHSNNIAKGVKELTKQMADTVPMAIAGGTSDGDIGTNMEKITKAINEVYSDKGVIVLFDLGSALMNAQMAIEFLDEEKQEKIKIVDAPLVEGTVTAAVESSLDKNIDEIIDTLKPFKMGKIQ